MDKATISTLNDAGYQKYTDHRQSYWYKTMPDGSLIVVTDNDGMYWPESDDFYVARYGSEADWVDGEWPKISIDSDKADSITDALAVVEQKLKENCR